MVISLTYVVDLFISFMLGFGIAVLFAWSFYMDKVRKEYESTLDDKAYRKYREMRNKMM